MAGCARAATLLAARVALAAAAPLLAGACATPLEVAFDERGDPSPHRTWSWEREPAQRVEAEGADGAALEAAVRRHVEERLEAKGFRRIRRGGDLVVGYRLAFARERVVEHRAEAPTLLSSLSYAPSYRVESTVAVTRTYVAMHLAIGVSRHRDGRTLWRAELRQRQQEEHALSLGEAVARLLERFPRSAPAPPCDAGARDEDAGAGPRCRPPRAPAPDAPPPPVGHIG